MNSKPISTASTLLIPLLFAVGVAAAPPVAAEPLVARPEPTPRTCAGSACVPSLTELLRRAPLPLGQSDLDMPGCLRSRTPMRDNHGSCEPEPRTAGMGSAYALRLTPRPHPRSPRRPGHQLGGPGDLEPRSHLPSAPETGASPADPPCAPPHTEPDHDAPLPPRPSDHDLSEFVRPGSHTPMAGTSIGDFAASGLGLSGISPGLE